MMATGGIQDDCRWSVDGVGMLFTMNPYSQVNYMHVPNRSALHLTEPSLDTVEWTTVSGAYVPDSAYRHVVLGGLFNDGLVTAVQFNPNGNINRAFAFIDDICVSYNPNDCGIETSLDEYDRTRFHTFPNPFTTDMHVSVSGPAHLGMEVCLQDLVGRVVWSGRVQPGRSFFTIDGSHLPEGVYVVSGKRTGEVIPSAIVVRVSH